jgi:glyoxylase-like metal-dependent hydrolase (beta-lactamase superfamily II)
MLGRILNGALADQRCYSQSSRRVAGRWNASPVAGITTQGRRFMTEPGRRRKRLAAVLAVAVGICLLVITVRWTQHPEVPLLDGSTITVVPGIHLVGELGPAAAYAIETPTGLVLIDSGLDGDARLLKAELGKLGLDWKNLRGIFLTHVHGDHCGGAEELRSETGATVYAGQADAPVLRSGGPREAFFSIYKMPEHSPHPTTVDVELNGGERIAFGSVHIQVLESPGHTPGSTCYLMDRAGLRVLFAGDVIERLRENPLGTYSTYLAPRYRGNAISYMATLRKLRALPVPDLVLPGHPRAHSMPQSPRLTPQEWEAMLDRGIRDMDQLVARYASDGANFLDGCPKRLLPDLYYFGDFQGGALYGFFAASKLFIVDAPGGTGLIEFLRTSQRQLGLPPTDPAAILLTACGPKETAGLPELVKQCGAQVVVSPYGVDIVREACPPDTIIHSTDDLPKLGWFSVAPILLVGRGLAPAAYVVSWAEKKVLFSGRIPAAIDHESLEELRIEFEGTIRKALAYEDSLRRLSDVNPDLWLAAVPYNGQNANLYDRAWSNLIQMNDGAVRHILEHR